MAFQEAQFVPLEKTAAVVTINNDQFRVEPIGPVFIGSLENTAKRSRDRNSALTVHLVVSFASKSARHVALASATPTMIM